MSKPFVLIVDDEAELPGMVAELFGREEAAREALSAQSSGRRDSVGRSDHDTM